MTFSANNLEHDLQRIERQLLGYEVLAATHYLVPLSFFEVECVVSLPDRLNFVQEFLLRAALEFKPPLTVKELASLMTLPENTISNNIRYLRDRLNAVEITPLQELIATPQGADLYLSKSDNLDLRKVLFAQTTVFTHWVALPAEYQWLMSSMFPSPPPMLPRAVPLAANRGEQIALSLKRNTELIIEVLTESNLDIHRPMDGYRVHKINQVNFCKEAEGAVALYLVVLTRFHQSLDQRQLRFYNVTMQEESPTPHILHNEAIDVWLDNYSLSLMGLMGISKKELDDRLLKGWNR